MRAAPEDWLRSSSICAARGLLELRVGGLLFGTQFDFDDLLDFVGKLGEDFLLAPAHQIGLQARRERRCQTAPRSPFSSGVSYRSLKSWRLPR